MRRRRGMLLLVAALLLGVAALGAGCGTATTAADDGVLDVVASTSFLADLAQNVAGDRFVVRSLVPLETDPHSFEPTPSDLGAVAAADLVIVNGRELEGPLLRTMESAVGDATVVAASTGLESRRPQPGEPALEDSETDPHFWLDPTLAKSYVMTIRNAFTEADPPGADGYAANATAYAKRLDELDTWIKAQVARIPSAERKLVMNHASHGYFADRYGLEVVGTVIPGVGAATSPTAKQLAALTETIRATGAKAIFVEIDENPELAQQIAAETGATVVTDLLDHSLTEPGGVAPTYIDMMKYDTRRIVEALQ